MDTETVEPKHVMCVMDETGDTKITWDEENEHEVANARRMFDDLLSKGFLAYSVKTDATKGKQVTKFDPTLEKLILSPQFKGG